MSKSDINQKEFVGDFHNGALNVKVAYTYQSMLFVGFGTFLLTDSARSHIIDCVSFNKAGIFGIITIGDQ